MVVRGAGDEADYKERLAEADGTITILRQQLQSAEARLAAAELRACPHATGKIDAGNCYPSARIAALDGTVADLNRQLASEVAENARLRSAFQGKVFVPEELAKRIAPEHEIDPPHGVG